MRHMIVTAFLGGLLLFSACQAAKDPALVSVSAPAAPPDAESGAGPAPVVTQSSKTGDAMPIYVAVTQGVAMSGPPVHPPLKVGAAEFRFSPDSGVLWVQPSLFEACWQRTCLLACRAS